MFWFCLSYLAFLKDTCLLKVGLEHSRPNLVLELHNFRSALLGWSQIGEHCWSNNVGGQKLNHLTSHLNNVETCVINMITQNLYFGFCQTFQPNKCVCDDVHRNWPITNEQLESQMSSRSCKHGGPLLEYAVGLICQWIQAHRRSGMSKN